MTNLTEKETAMIVAFLREGIDCNCSTTAEELLEEIRRRVGPRRAHESQVVSSHRAVMASPLSSGSHSQFR